MQSRLSNVTALWQTKTTFPNIAKGEGGSLRYFLDDCLKMKKFEKDSFSFVMQDDTFKKSIYK